MKSLIMLGIMALGLTSSPKVMAQKRHKVMPDTGMASYYAERFHLRKTASGEVFHKDSLTAAHKWLPFGTMVKVTSLKNNKSVVVKINDRGMPGLNRIIDLSPAAARELEMQGRGLQKVRVEYYVPGEAVMEPRED